MGQFEGKVLILFLLFQFSHEFLMFVNLPLDFVFILGQDGGSQRLLLLCSIAVAIASSVVLNMAACTPSKALQKGFCTIAAAVEIAFSCSGLCFAATAGLIAAGTRSLTLEFSFISSSSSVPHLIIMRITIIHQLMMVKTTLKKRTIMMMSMQNTFYTKCITVLMRHST